MVEEYIVYRIGYKYDNKTINFKNTYITDLKTALSVLENERKENIELDCVLVQETVKRIYLNV